MKALSRTFKSFFSPGNSRRNAQMGRLGWDSVEVCEARQLLTAVDPFTQDDATLSALEGNELDFSSEDLKAEIDALYADRGELEAILASGATEQLEASSNELNFTQGLSGIRRNLVTAHNGTGLFLHPHWHPYASRVDLNQFQFGGTNETVVEVPFVTSEELSEMLMLHVGEGTYQSFHVTLNESGLLEAVSGGGRNAREQSSTGKNAQSVELQPNAQYSLRIAHVNSELTATLTKEREQIGKVVVPFQKDFAQPLTLTGRNIGTPTIFGVRELERVDLTTLHEDIRTNLRELNIRALNAHDSLGLPSLPSSQVMVDVVLSEALNRELTPRQTAEFLSEMLAPEIQNWVKVTSAIDSLNEPLSESLAAYRDNLHGLITGLRQAAMPYARAKISIGTRPDGLLEASATVEASNGKFEVRFYENYNPWRPTAASEVIEVTGSESITRTYRARSSRIYRVEVIDKTTGEILRTADYRHRRDAEVEQSFLSWQEGLLAQRPLQSQLRVIHTKDNAVVLMVTSPFDVSAVRVKDTSAALSSATLHHEGGTFFASALVALPTNSGKGRRVIELLNAEGHVLDSLEVTVDYDGSIRNRQNVRISVVDENRFVTPQSIAADLDVNYPIDVTTTSLSYVELLANEADRERLIEAIDDAMGSASLLTESYWYNRGNARWYLQREFKSHSTLMVDMDEYMEFKESRNRWGFPEHGDLDRHIREQYELANGRRSFGNVKDSILQSRKDTRTDVKQDVPRFNDDVSALLVLADQVRRHVLHGEVSAEGAVYELNERIKRARVRVKEGMRRPTAQQLMDEIKRLHSSDLEFLGRYQTLIVETGKGYFDHRPTNGESFASKGRTTTTPSRRLERIQRQFEQALLGGDPRVRAMLKLRESTTVVTSAQPKETKQWRTPTRTATSNSKIHQAPAFSDELRPLVQTSEWLNSVAIPVSVKGTQTTGRLLISDDGTVTVVSDDNLQDEMTVSVAPVLVATVGHFPLETAHGDLPVDDLFVNLDSLMETLDNPSLFQFSDDPVFRPTMTVDGPHVFRFSDDKPPVAQFAAFTSAASAVSDEQRIAQLRAELPVWEELHRNLKDAEYDRSNLFSRNRDNIDRADITASTLLVVAGTAVSYGSYAESVVTNRNKIETVAEQVEFSKTFIIDPVSNVAKLGIDIHDPFLRETEKIGTELGNLTLAASSGDIYGVTVQVADSTKSRVVEGLHVFVDYAELDAMRSDDQLIMTVEREISLRYDELKQLGVFDQD